MTIYNRIKVQRRKNTRFDKFNKVKMIILSNSKREPLLAISEPYIALSANNNK